MSITERMSDKELIDKCIKLDKEKSTLNASQNAYKAELQNRGLAILEDKNIKYHRFYGSQSNLAAVSESQELNILNMDKLEDAIGKSVLSDKVTPTTKTTYKVESTLEKALKAIFTGNYTFEHTLDEFLDMMSVKVSSKQKSTLMKRLKGDYLADKKVILSVLGYMPQGTSIEAAEAVAPDFDVELYYISKIKNAELIQAYLPEEDIDWSIKEVRKSVLVETKVKVELSYEGK